MQVRVNLAEFGMEGNWKGIRVWARRLPYLNVPYAWTGQEEGSESAPAKGPLPSMLISIPHTPIPPSFPLYHTTHSTLPPLPSPLTCRDCWCIHLRRQCMGMEAEELTIPCHHHHRRHCRRLRSHHYA